MGQFYDIGTKAGADASVLTDTKKKIHVCTGIGIFIILQHLIPLHIPRDSSVQSFTIPTYHDSGALTKSWIIELYIGCFAP
jgi:hypothetical protein